MLPGDHVTASIRLVRLLGHGGMGSVWIAEHERLKTQVVVKFILGEYASLPEVLARFEREASLAAQAKSPHVVQVFDHGVTDDGLPYIAMEYLEGEDLATRIERDGNVEPSLFAEWFRQACVGLGRAHSKNIVHRDLKPENIFLCNEDGEVLVKLLDFGIAKKDSADPFQTQSGAFLGTAHYMSPEQTMGAKNIDFRTDLWAMGVVAYYALTGRRPFEADAIGPLVLAITSDDVPPPSSHVPGLPPGVNAWVRKALAKDPAARFQSAREMALSLIEAVTGQPALGRSGDFAVPTPGQRALGESSSAHDPTTFSPTITTPEAGAGLAKAARAAKRKVRLLVAAAVLGVVTVVTLALTISLRLSTPESEAFVATEPAGSPGSVTSMPEREPVQALVSDPPPIPPPSAASAKAPEVAAPPVAKATPRKLSASAKRTPSGQASAGDAPTSAPVSKAPAAPPSPLDMPLE